MIKNLALLALLLPAALHAQTVYRCGNTYQDTPCEASQPGQVVDVADPRSAAQVKAAAANARADAKRADAQAAERRTQERASAKEAQRAHKAAAKAVPPKQPASKPAPAEKPMLYRAPTTQS